MVKSWQKKIDKLDSNLSKSLYKISQDVINLNLDLYDIKKLEGNNFFRLRKGKIRIVFEKSSGKGIIKNIDFRGDVYKGI